MKTIATILCLSMYLILEGQAMSVTTSQDEAVIEQHMMEDLADLLNYRNKEQDQPQMDNDPRKYPKLKPGQIISPCSYYTYGCCQDGKTKAEGPNKQGCGKMLCADTYPGYCMMYKRRLNCKKGSTDNNLCTFTCNACPKKPASKLEECMRSRTIFGCCWNGKPALTPGKRDCPPCVDFTPHICSTFRHVSGGCNSGSYGIRTFMQKRCGRTCGQCTAAHK